MIGKSHKGYVYVMQLAWRESPAKCCLAKGLIPDEHQEENIVGLHLVRG